MNTGHSLGARRVTSSGFLAAATFHLVSGSKEDSAVSNPKHTLDVAFFRSLAHELRTQDNACTSYPLWTVQEEIGPAARARWVTAQTCFTLAAARAYIELQSHNHGDLRVYAVSAYRNPEMRKLREQLLALDEFLAKLVEDIHETARVTHDQLGGNNETADLVSEAIHAVADRVAEKLGGAR